jgi:hypothetical protein
MMHFIIPEAIGIKEPVDENDLCHATVPLAKLNDASCTPALCNDTDVTIC